MDSFFEFLKWSVSHGFWMFVGVWVLFEIPFTFIINSIRAVLHGVAEIKHGADVYCDDEDDEGEE